MIDVSRFATRVADLDPILIYPADREVPEHGSRSLSIDDAIKYVKEGGPCYFDLCSIRESEEDSINFDTVCELIWYIYSQVPTDRAYISEVYLERVKENLKNRKLI